jgi:hypothetical protein
MSDTIACHPECEIEHRRLAGRFGAHDPVCIIDEQVQWDVWCGVAVQLGVRPVRRK